MIEITAKQLYDIYKELPYISEFPDYDKLTDETVTVGDYQITFQAITKQKGWKPTTDLIIKS